MIRLYRENTSLLVEIWLRATLKSHSFIDENYWLSSCDAMREQYLPSAENYAFYDESGRVLGFISLIDNHIEALFVDPEHQGKGIGRRLLDHAKSIRPELTLAVYERNGKAVMFYHRNRFAVREHRIDEDTGEYELLMEFTP